MKLYFHASLLLICLTVAAEGAGVQRHVAFLKRRSQAELTTYFRGKPYFVKPIVAMGRLRGFSILANAAQINSLKSQFVDIVVETDKIKTIKGKRATSTALQASSASLTHLNMWGPNRVVGSFSQQSRSPLAATNPASTGTKVCVLDTGVAWDHPRLARRIYKQFNHAFDFSMALDNTQFGVPLAPRDLNQYCENLDYDETDPASPIEIPCGYDDDGHGSHVTGIIAAENVDTGQTTIDVQGIDPTARIIAGKVLGWHYYPETTPTGQEVWTYGYFGYSLDIALGIWECLAQGAQVINMSLGGDASEIEHMAIAEAAGQGVIIVAAAGNEFDETTGFGPVTYPARYPEVISVAALGVDGKIASFSSRGNKVDFIAPGESILSTVLDNWGFHFIRQPAASDYFKNFPDGIAAGIADIQDLDAPLNLYPFYSTPVSFTPGYVDIDGDRLVGAHEFYSGTSMASPYVAGIASRMLANAPYASASDLKGVDIGLASTQQGAGGLINAEQSCRR